MTQGAEGLDTGLFVAIGGLEQWITVRGRDRRNPILMVVPGLGGSLARLAPLFTAWEEDFTVVQWDQPGAGATYAKIGGSGEPLTFERIARDGVAVADYIARQLGQPKIAVMGVSGGTITAMMMVKARPDLFFAYVGAGQVTRWAEQEQASYAMILNQARAAGDQAAIAEIEAIGPPPWTDVASVVTKAKYANAMTPAELAVLADPALMTQVNKPPDDARYVARGLPEHDPREVSLAAFTAVWSEMEAFDALALGRFEAPMVFLQGERDAHTTTPEVQAFVAEVEAPSKTLAIVPGGGHMALFMADAMMVQFRRHVLPLAG